MGIQHPELPGRPVSGGPATIQQPGLETAGPLLAPNPLDPLDRQIDDRDRRWLRLAPAGPPAPPNRSDDLPRTTFEHFQPGDSGLERGVEPLPFHQAWVIVALLVWGAIWLTLYATSAIWLRL